MLPSLGPVVMGQVETNP